MLWRPVGRVVMVLLILLGVVSPTAKAQSATAEQTAAIVAKRDELAQIIDAIPSQSKGARWLPDVRVYLKAADWIVRHDEFYKPHFAEHTLQALDTGLERATALQRRPALSRPAWMRKPGTVILGYVSAVDRSVQPYALTLPEGVDPRSTKRWPLHVKLHGRGGTLNEVSFIHAHDGKPLTGQQDWIQLDVFGRVNNAFRWAGETDVFEALADVQQRFRIDERRITLWGFSMGGAGAWHLGLHHPSRWSSMGAGAGFVDYYKYQNKTERLPDVQHRGLHIYDAVDYALNASLLPVITYGGENDKQLAASQLMQAAAEEQDVDIVALVGKGMGHKFDDVSFETFMAFHREHADEGRKPFPGRKNFRFVTWTPKYNRCEWLTIAELTRMYERATVESVAFDDGSVEVTTDNVDALLIDRGVGDEIVLDGDGPFSLGDAAGGRLPAVYFVRGESGWDLLDYDASIAFDSNPDRRKRRDLQGPIDDAFMQPFVCVRGTGSPWSARHQEWADWTLARFEGEFDKWMRGRVEMVDDTAVTEKLIAEHNLILFGDPGSNALIKKVIDALPVEWTAEELTVNGQSYDPATHGVALIYPNPLNPRRYVVINSGMTMHEKDFKASNSNLFPKRGDMAVQSFVKQKDGAFTETLEWSALFGSDWELSD